MAGRIRDVIAEVLYVKGEKRAAQAIAIIPARLLLASEGHTRRQKEPLLQPAFEAKARRKLKEYTEQLRLFAQTDAARRIDERIEREKG